MKCPNCNAELTNSNAVFCPHCGMKIQTSQTEKLAEQKTEQRPIPKTEPSVNQPITPRTENFNTFTQQPPNQTSPAQNPIPSWTSCSQPSEKL